MVKEIITYFKEKQFLNYYIKNSAQNPECKDPMFSIAFNPHTELYTISYLHAGIDFTKHKNRIARGLTVDKYGKIVLIGFEKFFNWNQYEKRSGVNPKFVEEFTHLETQGYLKCHEKLDGTMIILGVWKDKLITSTTSNTSYRMDRDGVTRENFWAKHAEEYFNSHPKKQEIIEYLKARNSCFVFEWIAPQNQIVISYDKEDFVLLAEINKDTHKRFNGGRTFGFTLPKTEPYTLRQLRQIQKHRTDIEGFVVENKYGNLIKVKTDYWFENHYDMFMFNARMLNKNLVNTICDAWFNNTIDDMLALQNQNTEWMKKDLTGIVTRKLEKILDHVRAHAERFETAQEIMASDLKYKSLIIAYIKSGKDVYGFHDSTITKIKKIVREELQAEGLCLK